MSWYLLDEAGARIPNVFSFKLEQSKGKPAVLSWSLPFSSLSASSNVSLWRGNECIFQGNVYKNPINFNKDLISWSAVGIDDTFHQQRAELIEALNQNILLKSTLNNCEGARAGYPYIDRNTHKVHWISLEKPLSIWETHGLHERDSVHITPLDEPLKGVSGSVKLSQKRLDSGVIDVGSYITGHLPHGIETYSGSFLEEQWKKLEFKALRAGYDIQYSELISIPYQRADLHTALSVLDNKDQLVSIPYHAYKANLLLSWAAPITTNTTVTVKAGDNCESIILTAKAPDGANENDIVNEMIQWINAYVLTRSFTTQLKFKLLITDDISLAQLNTASWTRLFDSRIQNAAIEGPIISYTLSNEGGVTWADVTFLWAPEKPFSINKKANLKSSIDELRATPKTPDQIIAWVNVKQDANQQFEYYQKQKTGSFDTFVDNFPLTELEIGLHPAVSEPIEYVERIYTV